MRSGGGVAGFGQHRQKRLARHGRRDLGETCVRVCLDRGVRIDRLDRLGHGPRAAAAMHFFDMELHESLLFVLELYAEAFQRWKVKRIFGCSKKQSSGT